MTEDIAATNAKMQTIKTLLRAHVAAAIHRADSSIKFALLLCVIIMNALSLIRSDYDFLADLLRRANGPANSTRDLLLLGRIKAELEVHTHLREAIFYPILLLKGSRELIEMVMKRIEDHREIKMHLKELDSFDPSEIRKLKKTIDQHVEGEIEMFPLIEHQFNADTLNDLGTAMQVERLLINSRTEDSPKGLISAGIV